MKKIYFLLGCTASIMTAAQVGINTTAPSTTFDVRKSTVTTVPEGVLITRMSGDELKAKDGLYGSSQHSTLVYATAAPAAASTKTSNIKASGFYYYDNGSGKWEAVIKEAVTPKFFYMPSVLINTTTLGIKTLDLHTVYNNQFSNPPVKSAGSTGSIPTLAKDKLEYYVTYYDNTLLRNISISADGVMSYEVYGNASDASFMNIIFVVK
ncbi:hypothetical protein [Chryseobacterium sp. HSC-36S06]|uniref:hypothetical protein n=1 Tax=Chryseobacterium sp. HSC-36S06 TaxID=2910970 RepID=UPI0020A14A35|nr:hypothetical protein [Chryseobacterium sp. HSC-36S06]MCP2039363.1 hypothetical protein [Chryseobacterium sp. HSC-36S06]